MLAVLSIVILGLALAWTNGATDQGGHYVAWVVTLPDAATLSALSLYLARSF